MNTFLKKHTIVTSIFSVLLCVICISSAFQGCTYKKDEIPSAEDIIKEGEKFYSLGTVSDNDLHQINYLPDNEYILIWSESCIVTREYDTGEISMTFPADGQTIFLGHQNFDIASDQYTKAADGVFWSEAEFNPMSESPSAQLIKFVPDEKRYDVEKEWGRTIGLAKIVSLDEKLFIHRIAVNGKSREYYIEEYDIETKAEKIIVSSSLNGESLNGKTIYSFAVFDNNFYVLTHSSDAGYRIEKYSIDGEKLNSYDLPVFSPNYMNTHSGFVGLEVYNSYFFFSHLGGGYTVLKLTDNRFEEINTSEHNSKEQLNRIPQFGNSDAEKNRFLFFKAQQRLVIFDKTAEKFYSIELAFNNHQLGLSGINERNELLLLDVSGNTPVYYFVDINKLLPD